MQENRFNKVRKLARILTKSIYAKLMAVHRVTTNKGGKTSGVDRVVWTIENDWFDAALSLKRKGYKPKPLRRIYIPFVRYADDFVITAASREMIENEIEPLVKAFLSKRGLSLSPEKTKITHVEDGFDFLSQNSRKYPNGKTLQMPTDKAVSGIKQKLHETMLKNLNAKPKELILQLNSILRGWVNYHKHIVSKAVFQDIDFHLWKLLGKWCKRRHANKSWKWIRQKYFSASNELCSFAAITPTKKGGKIKILKIFRAAKVPIIRHNKINSSANPFVKEHENYYIQRRIELKQKSDKTKQNCIMLKKYKDIDKTLLHLWKCKAGDRSKKVA